RSANRLPKPFRRGIAAVRILKKQNVAKAVRLMACEFRTCGNSLLVAARDTKSDLTQQCVHSACRAFCCTQVCVAKRPGHDKTSGDFRNPGTDHITNESRNIQRCQ